VSRREPTAWTPLERPDVNVRVRFEMLDIITTRSPGLLRLVGEIDLSNAERLDRILRVEREWGWELSLDLSEVTFIDSTGLQVLLDLSRSYPVVILQPSDSVRRLFEVAIPHGAPGLKVRGSGEV
jgi:anti-anti-sigma factor